MKTLILLLLLVSCGPEQRGSKYDKEFTSVTRMMSGTRELYRCEGYDSQMGHFTFDCYIGEMPERECYMRCLSFKARGIQEGQSIREMYVTSKKKKKDPPTTMVAKK